MRHHYGEWHDYSLEKKNLEVRRQRIIKEYEFHLPLLRNYIYLKNSRNHNFQALAKTQNEVLINDVTKRLFLTVIDVRNNLDAFNPDSNSIFKSDNKFSNETKDMIKILARKGWNYQEIAYEMERIYGNGVIASMDHMGFPYLHERIFSGILGMSMIGMGMYIFVKLTRKLKRRP